MNLHLDSNAFRVLIEDIHESTGYRSDVLEKDYYVVLLLKELASMQQHGLPAYFKSGTALYKALKSTNRFSEDIDLSVDTRGCTNSQNNKRLENATKKYSVLPRDRTQGKTNRSEVIAVYTYDPIADYDANDSLQRFGKLKIEATSFTISEPVTSLDVTPILYDLATDRQKQVLESLSAVKPFPVMTITTERIFVDKLFAAESYIRKSDEPHRAFEAAKHLYDLAVLSATPQIKSFLASKEQVQYMLTIRLKEEMERRDGIPGVLPKDFSFFDEAPTNAKVKVAYEIMQRQYVLQSSNRIAYPVMIQALDSIKNDLNNNSSWWNAAYEK